MFFWKKNKSENKIKMMSNTVAVCPKGHTFSVAEFTECPFCNPKSQKKKSSLQKDIETGIHGTRIIPVSPNNDFGKGSEDTITDVTIIGTPMKDLSSDGLERLGGGAEGTVYALDDDRILKIYKNTNEDQIRKWYRNIKAVDKSGVRCAKAYEMVRADEGYGIIFEKLIGRNLGWTINAHPEKLEEYAVKMGRFLKKINSSHDENHKLEKITDRMLADLDTVSRRNIASGADLGAIEGFFRSIEDRNTLVHCDYHEGNVIVDENDELILIDLDRMGVGHPIYELVGNYLNHDVLIAKNPEFAGKSWGLNMEQIIRIKKIMLETYYGTSDEKKLEEYLGIVRDAFLVRSTLFPISPMFGMDDEAGRAYIKDRLGSLSCSISELPDRIKSLPI